MNDVTIYNFVQRYNLVQRYTTKSTHNLRLFFDNKMIHLIWIIIIHINIS